jgi:hypothetical protein
MRHALQQAMALARSLSVLASVVLASSLAVLAGCGGKSLAGDDLNDPNNPNDPSDPNDPNKPDASDPPACPAIAQACDPGDVSVGSEANCGGADYCYSRTETCTNSILWCAHNKPPQCKAIPTCDDGDKQVNGCPPLPKGASCYPRTACGSTIQCVHYDACKSLPQCDPGDVEVMMIDTCSKPGISCYSRTACNFTIHCYTP